MAAVSAFKRVRFIEPSGSSIKASLISGAGDFPTAMCGVRGRACPGAAWGVVMVVVGATVASAGVPVAVATCGTGVRLDRRDGRFQRRPWGWRQSEGDVFVCVTKCRCWDGWCRLRWHSEGRSGDCLARRDRRWSSG